MLRKSYTMKKVEIIYNQVNEAISVMKEVAQWGREQGFRVWLDEWLTPEELLTNEVKPENFCVGKIPVMRFIYISFV